MKHLTLFLISSFFLSFISCKKDSVAPIDQLPPATQEGKFTLGFLVNGKAWVPSGNDGTPNLSFMYERFDMNGSFMLSAYRYTSKTDMEYFYIYSDSLNHKRTFSLRDPLVGVAGFYNGICGYHRDPDVYHDGEITFTKLDLEKHIASGTFWFTLAKDGCDTIRVTDGRFDLKF